MLFSNPGRVINRYPNTRVLCRKDFFKNMMDIASDNDEDAFDFIPPSFTFPQDQEKFQAYAKANKGLTYIAKPLNGSQGENIVLFQNPKNLDFDNSDQVVVQRYIDDPLLVDGFKFDLRIYVAVTGINDGEMHAFIADEGLARFCTEQYHKPDRDNLG